MKTRKNIENGFFNPHQKRREECYQIAIYKANKMFINCYIKSVTQIK